MNPGVLSDALDNHGRVTPLDHEEGQRLTTERPKTERVLDILGPLGRPIGGVAATSPVNATESSQCRGLMPENESAQPCRIRKGVDRAGERCPPALWRRHERRVQCVSPSQRACVPTPPGQRTRSASRGRSPADARAPTAGARRQDSPTGRRPDRPPPPRVCSSSTAPREHSASNITVSDSTGPVRDQDECRSTARGVEPLDAGVG